MGTLGISFRKSIYKYTSLSHDYHFSKNLASAYIRYCIIHSTKSMRFVEWIHRNDEIIKKFPLEKKLQLFNEKSPPTLTR